MFQNNGWLGLGFLTCTLLAHVIAHGSCTDTTRELFLWFLLLFCCPVICADLIDSTPAPLIPASLPTATPKTDSALQPHPLMSTGRDVRFWWAAIQRRHCTAAKSLQWCSLVPVLIQHMQDTPCYAPTDDNVSCPGVRLNECRPQRADHNYAPLPILLIGLHVIVGFDQNCLRQGRRQKRWHWGHQESMTWRATGAETLFFNAAISEDEDDKWRYYGGPFSVWDFLTGLQTMLTVIIILC